MPDISSPKKILMTEPKVEKTGSNTAGLNRVLIEKEPEIKKQSNSSDVFVSDSIQKNIPKSPESSKNILSQTQGMMETYSKMAETYSKIQEKVNFNKQMFIDVSDKLAAIYGEKEKDIKDKLSDVFKKLMMKQYNPLSGVDGTLEHNADNGGNGKGYRPFRKKNPFKKGIDYRLFEIAGEILALSRYVRVNFKRKFYKGFKKFKQKIIYTLNKIESMIEPNNKFN